MKIFTLNIVLLLFVTNLLFAKNKPLYEIKGSDIVDFTFSGNGECIIARSNSIEFWDIYSNLKLQELKNTNNHINHCIDLNSDQNLAVLGTKDGYAILWDIKKAEVLWETKLSGLITRIKISPDNLFIFAGSSNSILYKLNIENGFILNELNNHSLDITDIEFDKTGEFLFSSSADGSIIIWDCKKNDMINRLESHENWVRNLSVSSDNKKMLSCDDDGMVILWDINNISKISIKNKHREYYSRSVSIDFYNDCNSYVISSINGYVKMITPYAVSLKRFKNIVLKVRFFPNAENVPKIAVLFKTDGLKIYDLGSFKIK